MLESRLIARCRVRALEMNVAAVAGDAGVKVLVNELDSETEVVAIKGN
jgi:hypothetical protein